MVHEDEDDKFQRKSSKKNKSKKKSEKKSKKSSKNESKKESRKRKEARKESKTKSKAQESEKLHASAPPLLLEDTSDTEINFTESEATLQVSSSDVKFDASDSKLSSREDDETKNTKTRRSKEKKAEIVLSSDSENGDFSNDSNDENQVEDTEDAAMRALMDSFIMEMGGGSDDESSSTSSSSSGPTYREVILENNVIDHVVLAAPDLESAILEFQEMTGIQPVVSSHIKGLGIKTARVSFEGSSFLEIIAPDPAKNGPVGVLLKSIGLTGLVPFHWAIRTENAEGLKPELSKLGYTPDCIVMTGASPNGTPRTWEMLYLYGQKMRGMCPFFINWDRSDHPSETMPIVGELIGVTIRAPADDLIHKLIDHTGSTGFKLEEGSPKFQIIFDSPEGEVTLEADKMAGFQFPGFEEEMGPIIGDAEEELPELVMPEFPEMLDLNTNYDGLTAI